METQGMTPEEKAMVMQFMGQTYGQMHKQDQMIVGQSGNLQPKSNQMKEVFEQTAHIPTVQQQAPQQPRPEQAPQPVHQVTPEQAAAQLQETRQPVPVAQPEPEVVHIYDDPEPEKDANQMELDLSEPKVADKLLNLLEEQNLLLKEISLKLDNGKKTTRGRKQK